MTTFTDHHALVTGGGSGMGAAIAAALHRAGTRLTLVDGAFAAARVANGPVDILINNAGTPPAGPSPRSGPRSGTG